MFSEDRLYTKFREWGVHKNDLREGLNSPEASTDREPRKPTAMDWIELRPWLTDLYLRGYIAKEILHDLELRGYLLR